MKRMNYKNFKKVHEDANSATLQHPEGHTIRIAKGPLSDHIKKQLGALQFADGGEVAATKDENGHWIPKEQPHDTNRVNSISGATEPYKAEKVHSSDESVISKPIQPNNDRAVPEAAKKVLGYADGGPVEEHGGMSMPNGQEVQPSAPEQSDIVSQMAQMQLPLSRNQTPMLPKAQDTVQQQMPQPDDYAQKAMDLGTSAATGQMQTEKQSANRQIDYAQKDRQAQAAINNYHQENIQNYMGEINNVIKDLKDQKIDPNHFWNERGTFGKASTAIGLILGGMGSGVTGGPNPALQFLNQQIDRDIEGQRMQQGQKMNMLTALQHQLGNEHDAFTMAKAMQASVYASKLMEDAAKSKDAMAIPRAQAAVSQLEGTYGPALNQVALKQAVLKGMQTGQVDPAKAVNIMVPPAQQVKAFDEIKTYENQKVAVKNLQDVMNKVAKLQSFESRVATPVQSKSQIDSLNTAIAGHVKEIFGRPSETEINLLNKNAINYLDKPETIATKTDNILKMVSQHNSSFPILRGNGINLPPINFGKFHK